MTSVFPIGLKLTGKRCLVFGSGPEQGMRAAALLECGALVRVVAPELAAELYPAVQADKIEYIPRGYIPGDLADAWLAVQVNYDPAGASQILEEAERARVFFCAVDQVASSYSHLAQARAGALVVAIGTNGQAPALARRLRQELQRLFDSAGATQAVERIAKLRERTSPSARRAVMQRAMQSVHLSGALHFGESGSSTTTESLPSGTNMEQADTAPSDRSHSNVGAPSDGGGRG